MFQTHSDVIAAIGNGRLASGVQVGVPRVAAWRRRNSIPSRYLSPVAEFAQSIGVSVTAEELALMVAAVPSRVAAETTEDAA